MKNIENFVFQNNKKYFYTQDVLLNKILEFKELTSLSATPYKSNYLSMLKNKKLISRFSKSSLITGIVQDEKNKIVQEELKMYEIQRPKLYIQPLHKHLRSNKKREQIQEGKS